MHTNTRRLLKLWSGGEEQQQTICFEWERTDTTTWNWYFRPYWMKGLSTTEVQMRVNSNGGPYAHRKRRTNEHICMEARYGVSQALACMNENVENAMVLCVRTQARQPVDALRKQQYIHFSFSCMPIECVSMCCDAFRFHFIFHSPSQKCHNVNTTVLEIWRQTTAQTPSSRIYGSMRSCIRVSIWRCSSKNGIYAESFCFKPSQ